MNKGVEVRSNIDPALSKKLHDWAHAHQMTVAQAVYAAIQHLVEEQNRRNRVNERLGEFERSVDSGLFDHPEGITKPGGFR